MLARCATRLALGLGSHAAVVGTAAVHRARVGDGRGLATEATESASGVEAVRVGAPSAPREGPLKVFDGDLKRAHRERSAYLQGPRVDPLQGAVAERLLDRMQDCLRQFETVLVLGGAMPAVRRQLEQEVGPAVGLKHIIYVDTAEAMLRSVGGTSDTILRTATEAGPPTTTTAEEDAAEGAAPTSEFVHVDDFESFSLAVAERAGKVDAVVACLGLHWYNDLPGVLIQINNTLKPDGLFLGAIYGGETLQELRITCAVAEQEREGGLSARVSPLAQVRDGGNLLGRGGFALPAVDVDTIEMRYQNAWELVNHLRQMGETNAVSTRRLVLGRDTALASAALYQSMFAEEDGSVPATFQIIYIAGWSPDISNQQQPKARGTATVSFADLEEEFEKEDQGRALVEQLDLDTEAVEDADSPKKA